MENSVATYDQLVWLAKRDFDLGKKYKWLSEADPEVIHLMNLETGEETVRPAAYGIVLGTDDYKSEDDALQKASEIIQSFSTKKIDASFNTYEIGIDGWSRKKTNGLRGLHINLCIYLGLELEDIDEEKKEVIQDFVEFLMWDKMEKPSYYSLLIERLNKNIKKDEYDFDEILDVFYTLGVTGILMAVSTPIRKYSKDLSAYSYSMGHQYSTWVYGDNFDLALFRAKEWMLAQAEQDKGK